MATSLGVIGLGSMGFPIANHFLDAGHVVNVYDVRDDPVQQLEDVGANGCGSPAVVGEVSEIAFVVVQDEDQVEEVLFGEAGLVSGVDAGDTIVISSSVSPEFCIELGEQIPAEVNLVDAPMARGADAAVDANLLIMMGGERSTYDAIAEVFHAIAPPEDVMYMGDLGLGQVAKMANNVILWAGLVADVEAFELCERYGMDIDHLTDALEKSSGTNWGVETWTERYPRHIPWAHKDMHVALETAEAQGMGMPLAGLVSQLVYELREEWKEYA